MPTKIKPDGSPETNRDPGDKDWEQKTARYDSRHSDQDSPYVTPEQAEELQDQVYGSDTQEGLAEQEQAAAETGSSDDIGTREATGDAGWTTKVEGETKAKATIFTKKRSLWALIALVTASAGFVMTGIITPAITLVNFKEVMARKFSKVESSVIDRRSNRILAKKFTKDITRGCGLVKIKCRYKGMTSREIKKFNRRNIGEGWRIESKGRSLVPPFKNKVELQKISGEGSNVKVEKVVDASKVKTTLRKDPSLQKSFRNFNKGRVSFWADSKARSLWKKLGVKLFKRAPEEGKGKTEEEKRIYRTNKEVSDVETNGEGHSPKNAGAGDAEKYLEDRANQLSEDANDPSRTIPPEPDISNPKAVDDLYGKTASNIEHASPGLLGEVVNPVASAIFNYCIVKDLTKATLNIRKTLIVIQLVRYAINFARLADQIKAGNAGADTTQEIGDMTRVLTAKDGLGRTAFDSFGYNWAAYGNLGARGPNEDITKYQTGGGPPGQLGGVVTAATSLIPDGLCKAATSPLVTFGLLIGQLALALSTLGLGNVAEEAASVGASQGLKAGIKFITDKAIAKVLEGLAKDELKNTAKTIITHRFTRIVTALGATFAFFHYAVPPMIGLIARAITGTTVTGDTHGPDAGNAAVSGFGASGAASGRAHGLAFLNKTDAVKSNQAASAYDKHLAKIDSINQFSLNDPNSFATKLAMAALPYTSQLSFAGAPDNFGRLFA